MLTLLITLALVSPPSAPVCIAPDGTRIQLELALTDQEKAVGLMYRDSLPADRGMLFPFAQDGVWPFWMKNTMIPLDMVWLSGGGEAVEVRTVQPCHLDPCASYQNVKPARAVLELNAGAAARFGIKPGVRLRFEGVKGYPVGGGETR
ncbi:MAG: DUF192 domain-containing protein [Acidobacteriota bacterium]